MSGNDLVRHYGGDGLVASLGDVLTAAGLGEGVLAPTALAAMDQFHTRGLQATAELAQAAGIGPADVVLDIGAGLGGPSRYLAAQHGCRVAGIDLSPSFVAAAAFLSMRAGLMDKVAYQCADALALPFDAGSFDVVWTQHVAMNIADRERLYAEVFRVLRPGGRFAIHDVVAREGREILYPVPWARTSASSFLLTVEGMRQTLESGGFQAALWADQTQVSIDWFDEQRARAQTGQTPPLGLDIVMGPDFPEMVRNLGANLREGRAGIVQAVMTRV